MLKMARNTMLLWAAGLLAAYWSLGLLAQHYPGGGELLGGFVSAALFVGGVLIATTSLPEVVRIFRLDQIGRGELALVGIFLVGAGATWSGGWGILWTIAGNPVTWVATVYSAFGRALMATGFFLIFLSPGATKEGIRAPSWWVILGGILAFLAIGTFLGVQITGTQAGRAVVGGVERTAP